MHKHEHLNCTKKTFDNPTEILRLAGIVKGNSLLDVGTGTGYLSIAASELVGPDVKVYALDIYKESIDALKQELSTKGIINVELVLADVVKGIPLPREVIDVCLMSNVLHGFVTNEEIDKVLKNINEVLKEDGRLVIIDFKKVEDSFGPPISIKLTPEEIEDIITPYGYVLKDKFDVGLAHYAVVFQRICLQSKHC